MWAEGPTLGGHVLVKAFTAAELARLAVRTVAGDRCTWAPSG